MSYKATPAAVKLALERGIPLSNVRGTGTGGFITIADVSKHVSPWTQSRTATLSETFGILDDAAILAIDVEAAVRQAKDAGSCNPSTSSSTSGKLKPPSKRAKMQKRTAPSSSASTGAEREAVEHKTQQNKQHRQTIKQQHSLAEAAEHPFPSRAAAAAAAAAATAAAAASTASSDEDDPEIDTASSSCLQLILDLDNTLVHAVEDDGTRFPADIEKDIHRFELVHEGDMRVNRYLLQLRDGVSTFLEQAKSLGFVIHMYTMGSYSYTQRVLDFLDPDESYFGVPPGKIMCRPEHGAVFKKSIAHVIEDVNQWDRVVVVDDRIDAWDSRAQPHVLQLPAYYFFGTSRPAKKDESELANAMAVLRGVHNGMGSGKDTNVPTELNRLRRLTLQGVHLVFSGGILRAEDVQAGTPERCMHWALALQFGAQCSMQFTDRVTHVISTHANTGSVQKAKARKLYAITPQWLLDSAANFKKLPEQRYQL